MDPTFRQATPADLEAVHALRRAFYQETNSAWDDAGGRRALEQLLEQPEHGEVWILESLFGPLGFLVLTFGYSLEFLGQDAFIDELYLAPAVRGMGHGHAAIKLSQQIAQRHGVAAVHLEVSSENDAALSLYTRNGFVDHGRRLFTSWIVQPPDRWPG
jgi:ribosomal protein S18 acetylase RimI-like enzyme